ncbi:hypothetical protein RB593_004036 [Gaeumannomyces tritici]
MDSSKLYALQEVPGKGLGLVATTKIAKSTRILSEAPLFRVPQSTISKRQVCDSLSKKVAALSDDKRQAFFSLRNSVKDEATRELGITRTNALPIGSDAATGGIFLEASRINHACLQNAQNTWNEGLQQLTIHAIRDINQGEEITIMYIEDRANRAARQRILQRNFRFTCSCQLCLFPPSLRASSDARLDEIQRVDKSIGDGIQITASPLQALHNARKLLKYFRAFRVSVLVIAAVPRPPSTPQTASAPWLTPHYPPKHTFIMVRISGQSRAVLLTASLAKLATAAQAACVFFWQADPGDTCQSIARDWSLTAHQFVALNPSVGPACANGVTSGVEYCVMGDPETGGPATITTKATTRPPTSTSAPPTTLLTSTSTTAPPTTT